MIYAIIMAAGLSRRMGKDNKLLLDLKDKKIVEHVILTCLESNIDETIIVYSDEKVGSLGKKYNLKTIFNPIATQGMSTSIVRAIKQVPDSADGVIILLGDMPFVNIDTINRMINELKGKSLHEKIIVPYFNGKRGNPVVFGKKYFVQLAEIKGDKGARDIINSNKESVIRLEIKENKENIDIDTKEMYQDIIGTFLKGE